MAETKARRQSQAVVSKAPVLPVRDTVHFPGVIQTLLIGRDMSVKALQAALKRDREALVLGQRDQGVDEPTGDDLYRTGTLSEVLHVLPLPDGTMRVVLRGLARARVEKMTYRAGSFNAELTLIEEPVPTGDNVAALMRECVATFQEAVALGLSVPPELVESVASVEDPRYLADLLSHHLPSNAAVKQGLLEEIDAMARLEELVRILVKERQVLEMQATLRTRVERELGQTQREYYLREQLKAIQQELGGEAVLSEEGEEYRQRLEDAGMDSETLDRAVQELRRLERAPSSSPEGMVIRTYLDWLAALPWGILSEDRIDVRKASAILEREHYGLAQVKDRILDFLAVRQLSQSLRGPILCFVGPPGVGKTSIGRSIAESLGRQFVRISLGGVRDEAEIRGHRRTYIGSMPGRLIQSLKSCGTRNPVFMLDEIDKMGYDFRGDPTSALLEALDPEQNAHFSDHYLEVPFDLSAVMFVATANLLENVPAALRDRMEVIRFPSYTEQEKLQIATKYLVPKKLVEHGLTKAQFKVPKATLEVLVREYTREAGVRGLEREIATICRKAARQIAEGETDCVHATPDQLGRLLGKPRYRYGVRGKRDEIGVATGLVYSEYGGDIVTIEVSLSTPFGDQPQVRLTGSLGDVMKESAYTAMTYLRANQERFSPDKEFRCDLHVHVPEGAVPKDGPSAGVTILTALVSAFTGKPVRRDVAMTGEVTLRGRVLPVGGVREKILAAHRAGIKKVVLPEENLRDLDDLPESVRKDIEFHPVATAEEALAIALG
ncbi:MAG: endopeptidase La [Fimbriimonadaceae bacterium]|nr:endopeptidase La [Fimbriimonadaceae bacterium]QYK55923.1 MAG: endopeptidase La [Fimbriimonadaceae bacterium]